MKSFTSFLAGAVVAASAAWAGPLQQSQVAADAKWVIHVDLDNFRETQLGQFLGDEFLDRHLAKATRDLERQFDIRFDWREIHALTAYGTEYKPRQSRSDVNGVLIIHSSFDFAQALDTVRDKLASRLAGGDVPLQKTESDSGPLFSFKNEVFGAALPGNLVVVSKSKDDVDKARQVLTGKAANLTATRTFAIYPTPKAFILLGAAEAFAEAPLPPQAKVFKNADGGQVVVGEKQNNCFVNVALNAKDVQAAAQIQQVAQGLVALAALNQTENKDLQILVHGTKISTNNKLVTLTLELPVTNVIAKVATAHKKRDRRDRRSAQ